ncbi:MAG: VOC family protein [Nannocystaceae bacterium]|nr:VOC family protein [bacterium]
MPRPYLTFDGQAAEALSFYAEVFGGEMLFSQSFGDSPMKDDIPPAFRDRLMHATVRLPSGELMASDTGPWAPFEGPMRSTSLSVPFQDAAAAREAFDALAEGGEITMPLERTFWAEAFGMVTDRFGVRWMINCDGTT